MEQHPVPQQISSYQFRLVGDMTLKQFFQLAAGLLVALLFYAAPLHPFIKWPIIAFSALTGAAFAFLPFEERPLEVWVFAFFRSIYSPTLFFWQKSEKPAVFFAADETAVVAIENTQHTTPSSPVNLSSKLNFLSHLEEGERSFLSRVRDLFGTNSKLVIPMTAPIVAPISNPITKIVTEEIKPTNPGYIVSEIVDGKPKTNDLLLIQKVVAPQEQQVLIPQAQAVTISKSPITAPGIPTAFTQNTDLSQTILPAQKTTSVSQVLPPQNLNLQNPLPTSAVFSPDAAPPTPPAQGNIIVGQVMDMDGKIIEGAILEVKDGEGRPVRALKTNRAGHFLIVTPLVSGKYQLLTEKNGFVFEPISFEANGAAIAPIAIKASRKEKDENTTN